MKRWFSPYAARYDALKPRERVLVMLALGAVLWFVLDTALLDPLAIDNKRLAAEVTQQQKQLKETQDLITLMQSKRVDVNATERARRDELVAGIAESNDRLRTVGRTLVPSDNMPQLLQGILERNHRLRLVALRSIPAAPLQPKPVPDSKDKPRNDLPAAGPKSGRPDIYRHGVEFTVQGSYADLVEYLVQLEHLPWRMFWGNVSMSSDYPKITLTVTVYTLSLEKALLTV
jgi:MSHA biogenesis protein MshJ